MRILRLVLTLLAGSALFSTSAQAASFSGGAAPITDFANGSEVSTMGTYISAVKLLNDNVGGVGVSTTINGVLFKGTAPGQFFENNESFNEASFVYHGGDGYADPNLWTSGGAYDTLADSQIFNIDNPNVNAGDGYGVINLMPGQQYLLQVFMLDDRPGIMKTFPLQFQQVAWAGNFDQIDNTNPPGEIGYIDGITINGNGVSAQANGQIATVFVTIDPGYNGLLVNTWNNGAFSGIQLRSLPTLLGDLNRDGHVNAADIVAMEQALTNSGNFKASHGLNDPTVFETVADVNNDGTVNNADLQGLLDLLKSGGGSANPVPEPSTLVMLSMAGITLFRFKRRGK
jgi:Dockerin type I domain